MLDTLLVGQALIDNAQLSPQLWSMAAGAILLQLIIGIFVQLQTVRLNSAYTQIEQIPTQMYNYDYFYSNNAKITFSNAASYYCFADF